MGNMHYCRFENTLADLRYCYDDMEESESMSQQEKKARKRLIKLCQRIADDYAEELEDA